MNHNKNINKTSTAPIASKMTNINPGQYNPYLPNQSGRNLPFQQNPNGFVPIDYRMSVHDDLRHSFRGDLNPLILKENQGHTRELIATIILLLGIIIPLSLRFGFPQDSNLAICITIFIVAYLLYLLIGCLSNDLHQYFSNIQQGHNFEEEYNRIRGLKGQFDFTAECYHNEMRYDTRRNMPRYEEIITHRANQTIVPAYTADISGNVERINSETNIVFIHFIVNYKFSNDYSRNKVDELFYNFKHVNYRDEHQRFNLHYNIPNLVEKMSFYVGELGCNYNCWYYVFTIFGLIYPYSLWVESKIKRFDVTYTKVVTM